MEVYIVCDEVARSYSEVELPRRQASVLARKIRIPPGCAIVIGPTHIHKAACARAGQAREKR